MLKEILKPYIVLKAITSTEIKSEIHYCGAIEEPTFLNALDTLFKEGTRTEIFEKDKFYYTPHVSIPRFKLKSFNEKEKTSTVKHYKDATAVVLSDKTFQKEITKGPRFIPYYGTTYVDSFLNFLEENSSEKLYDNLRQQIKSLNESPIFISLDTWRLKSRAESMFDITFNGVYDSKLFDNSATNISVSSDFLEFVEHVLENGVDVINEKVIQKKLNSFTITQEMYENLVTSFKSPDDSNVVLAMETMANCDYEKSAFYLLKLFDDFRNRIRYSSTLNHVNFKALTTFFDIDVQRKLSSYFILEKMEEKNLINSSNREMLEKLYFAPLEEEVFSEKDISAMDWYTHKIIPSLRFERAVLKGDEYLKSLESEELSEDMESPLEEKPNLDI